MAFGDKWNKFWKDVGNGIEDIWDTLTGKTEKELGTKAQKLAEESQQFNEQFSEKQLQQQQEQFEKSQGLAEESLQWQKESAAKNFQMQQDVFNAQQRENELTRQREDTAYQRQVADLKAAGLSPLMASNGAAATNVQVGEAPQFDSSGIQNAYGSYIQMAREYAELKNMAEGQYLSRRQEAINQRIGASMALAQMSQSRRQMYWNNALSGMNIAANVSSLRKRNQLIDEQIQNARDTRNWSNKYGWRNLNNWAVLLPALNKISESLNIDYDKVGSILKDFGDSINGRYSTYTGSDKSFNELKNNLDILDNNSTKELFDNMLSALNSGNKTEYVTARNYYKNMSEDFRNDWEFEDFYKAINHQDKKLLKKLVLYLNFGGYF